MTTLELIKTLRTLEQQENRGNDCAGYEIDELLESFDEQQPTLSAAMSEVMKKHSYLIEASKALAIVAFEQAQKELAKI